MVKKNERGQALVEFIIILPVFLLLVFCVVDFGRIISLKNELENVTSDAITYYENGEKIENIQKIVSEDVKDIKLTIKDDDGYITLKVEKKLVPITPGFNYLPSNIFEVSASRTFKQNTFIEIDKGEDYEQDE